MESLTASVAARRAKHHRRGRGARRHDAGDRVAGMPKLRIEESAARRQARIDRGEDVIVGVNKYQLAERRARSTCARSTTPRCASRRSRGSRELRATRDAGAVRAHARRARGAGAQRARATCSSPAVEAARARATVGEISDGAREGLGAPPRRDPFDLGRLRRCYRGRSRTSRRCAREVEAFAEEEGRRPRMLVAKLGQDGHDRGTKVIATRLRRPRLRRRRRAALPDAGRGRAPGDRERRARGRRLEPGGRAQDAGAAARRGAARRRAPATSSSWSAASIPPKDYAFLREQRRRGDLRPRHAGPEGRARGAAGDPRAARAMSPDARRRSRRFRDGDPARAIGARSRKAITLLESTRADQRGARPGDARALLPRHRRRVRVGITGAPGVGKSTFIEALGLHLIGAGQPRRGARGRSVAARVSGGSILGDKTRMERLAQERARLHPAVALGRLARRRRAAHARGDAGLRGGGLRRGARRDRRRRPVRGRRRARWSTSSCVLLLPGAGRRAAGHQEGHARAGRRAGREQGRRRAARGAPSARAPSTRARSRCCGAPSPSWRPPVLLASALTRRGHRGGLGDGRSAHRAGRLRPAASSRRAAASRRAPGCGAWSTRACSAAFRSHPEVAARDRRASSARSRRSQDDPGRRRPRAARRLPEALSPPAPAARSRAHRPAARRTARCRRGCR